MNLPDITAFLNVALGGGVVAILSALRGYIKDRSAGRVMRDDTAITRWREIADEREDQARGMRHELDWYRATYPRIYAEWLRMPPEDADRFPAVPPPPPRETT